MPHDHQGLPKPHLPQPMRQPLSPSRESVTVTACRFLLRDEGKKRQQGFYDITVASVHRPPTQPPPAPTIVAFQGQSEINGSRGKATAAKSHKSHHGSRQQSNRPAPKLSLAPVFTLLLYCRAHSYVTVDPAPHRL